LNTLRNGDILQRAENIDHCEKWGSMVFHILKKRYQRAMSETNELIIGIGVMVAAIMLARTYHGWRIKRAYILIIEDLKAKGALTPETAVALPYAPKGPIQIGLKDHRKTALKSLVRDNLVGVSEDGRYYLIHKTL
jgi:hypothetical protein